MIVSLRGWHVLHMARSALLPLSCVALLGCSPDQVVAGGSSAETDQPYEPEFPCETQSDCPPDYFCSNGECFYDSKPGPNCSGSLSCPVGSFCDGWDCVSWSQIETCEGPELDWLEERTRVVFYQGFDDFEVHDLDGDGREELLSWGVSGLQGFVDDERRILAPLPGSFGELESQVLIDLDDDGLLDLLVRARNGSSWIARGLPEHAFEPWQAGPSLDILSPVALRWNPDAPPMLAGTLELETSKIAVLGELLAEPMSAAEFGSTSSGSLKDPRALNFDGEPGQELFYRRHQTGILRAAAGWYAQVPNTFEQARYFFGADLDDDGDAELLSLEHGREVTMVNLMHGGTPQLDESGEASFEYSRFALPDVQTYALTLRVRSGEPRALWLASPFLDPIQPKLVRDALGEQPCYEFGPELAPGLHRIPGDFDGDGVDELAQVDAEGRLSLLDPG